MPRFRINYWEFKRIDKQKEVIAKDMDAAYEKVTKSFHKQSEKTEGELSFEVDSIEEVK